jgi:hypothetical protein
MARRTRRFALGLVASCCCAAVGAPSARAQSAPEINRPVFVAAGTEILDRDRKPVRKTETEEVLVVREIADPLLWCESRVPALAGGFVPASATRPATRSDLTSFAREASTRTSTAATTPGADPQLAAAEALAARLLKEEEALAPALPPGCRPAPPLPPGAAGSRSPVIGYLKLPPGSKLTDAAIDLSGRLLLAGLASAWPAELGLPARSLSGTPRSPGPGAFSFLIRFAPDLSNASDLVLEPLMDYGHFTRIAVHPSGDLLLLCGNSRTLQPGETARLLGPQRGDSGGCVLRLDGGLVEREWFASLRTMPPNLNGFRCDGFGRLLLLHDFGARNSSPELRRLFVAGGGERPWRGWNEGSSRVVRLTPKEDFLRPWFGVWTHGDPNFPALASPIGKKGQPSRAGTPIVWGGSEGKGAGPNPIVGASYLAEGLLVTRENRPVLMGSIAFNMPQPDFDPFILALDPEGKPLWANVPIEGLLSEPDQKYQCAAIDPSNGDLVVSFWEHGENVHTLYRDPDGLIPTYNGSSGNMKATWIGRFDGTTGAFRSSTFLMAKKASTLASTRPAWNSLALKSLACDSKGLVHVAGASTRIPPTTADALIPGAPASGGGAYFATFTPDLRSLTYATHLTRSGGSAETVLCGAGDQVIILGTAPGRGDALPASPRPLPPYLSSQPASNADGLPFLAILMPPREPAPAQWKLETP